MRKRVLNIDWSLSALAQVSGKTLFPAETVTTVGDTYIHAWSTEDAQRYIKTLLEYKPDPLEAKTTRRVLVG